MKKLIYIFLVLIGTQRLVADEGMFLVHLLGEKTYQDMQKRGLKLTKEQLYSINNASLKDAIVLFGGGCTAEVVSKEGLLFTNHHCGYDAIASASSVEHNYLRDGFWAKSRDQEIPCPGLSVQFLLKIEDVTAAVMEKLKDVPPTELTAKLPGILNEMSQKAQEGTTYEVRVSSFFKGNQFLQFTYERYKDIRLVGTPPESIGKFGGDTDNWEWPRHTGDFSVFRVYMGADGKAADYKADNVPYKPKYSLPVSIKGVKDGDYAMIYGYPGGTNRYETSYGVKLKIDVENPNLVNLRDFRLKAMHTEMIKDPAVKIKLASSYAGIANYWKFFDGETKQLIKHHVLEQKEKEEADFLAWAAKSGKKEYSDLFSRAAQVYDAWKPYSKGRVYLNEGIMGSPLIAFGFTLKQLDGVLSNPNAKPEDVQKTIDNVKKAYTKFYKGEDMTSDKIILAGVVHMFYTDIDAGQRPAAFYSNLATKYGDLNADETYRKFSNDVFSNTFLLSADRWDQFIAKPDTAILHKDPAYATFSAFLNNFNNNYGKKYTDFSANVYAIGNQYLKGVLEMKKGQNLYPDANQTMRVSYGNVKSYSPRDAVKYSEICTLKGVMEKYVPGDYEFDVPAGLIDLIRKKDYGQYVDKSVNDVVVTFITTNDITGGNSGSPVLNAKGELIGLAFDGNYEALSHKIAFDGDLNRTICLDVRYLLFVMDKLGGATNLIKELDLK